MSPRNVFDFLDEVRARPSMFVAEKASGLTVIQDYLVGYYVAVDLHGIVEPGPRVTQSIFSLWLRLRGYEDFALGWAWVLRQAHGEAAFDKFFDLLDEYRSVSPTVVATVGLTEDQRRRGGRVLHTSAWPMEMPDHVDVVQYAPHPMHIVRVHCGRRWIEHVLYAPSSAAPVTTLDHAFAWAAEIFGVEHADWSIP